MSRPIPLIRAAALAPFLLWMRARGLSWEGRLRDAGLPTTLLAEPERPIAFLAGTRFLVATGEAEGPDIGCRVVSDTSIAQLASFGQVALGARTPRDALARLMRAYPHHSSHEHFVVASDPGAGIVRHRFLVDLDDAALHLCQQYVAAMVRAVTAGTGVSAPGRVAAVRLVPHPVAGLDHLRRRRDMTVEAATDRALTVALPDAALDQPYLLPTRDRGPLGLSSIRGDGSLACSLRTLLPGILDAVPSGSTTSRHWPAPAGARCSAGWRRKNTSLSDMVEGLRREQALRRVVGSSDPVGDIAADLGYSAQSSLTRAIRRWTNAAPSQLRQG